MMNVRSQLLHTVLQCVAVNCSELQCVAGGKKMGVRYQLLHTVLQCFAVCCSELQ